MQPRGFHQQKFPRTFDGALRRFFERQQLKRAAGQTQQFLQGRLAGLFPDMGVDDVAVFNVNPSAHLLVVNFENGRIAAQTFHLDDILQANLAQHAMKTFAGCPGNQIIEHGENHLHAVRRARFLDEKLRAVGQAKSPVFSGGMTGHHGQFDVGMAARNHDQQLHAVQNGHIDVNDRELERLLLEHGQGLVGAAGKFHFPTAVTPEQIKFRKHFVVDRVVVHKQHSFFEMRVHFSTSQLICFAHGFNQAGDSAAS